MSDHHLQDNDYTDREIRTRPLAVFLVATLAVTVLTIIGVKILFNIYSNEAGKSLAAIEQHVVSARPEAAVVEGLGDAAESMRRLRMDEDARLNHYQWSTNGPDLVQIPISRAMEILVQKGFSTRSVEKVSGNASELQK